MLSITQRQPRRGRDEPHLWNGLAHNKIYFVARCYEDFTCSKPSDHISEAKCLLVFQRSIMRTLILEMQKLSFWLPESCQRGHTLVHKENLKVKSNKNIVPGRGLDKKKGCWAQFVQPGCVWISSASLVRLELFLKDIKLTESGGGHDVGK